MTPFAALVSQLTAAREHRPDPLPEIKRRGWPRGMQKGSGPSKVLECIEGAKSTMTSADVIHRTKLDCTVVRTALNWLLAKGKIERVNEEPPYLYRAVDS